MRITDDIIVGCHVIERPREGDIKSSFNSGTYISYYVLLEIINLYHRYSSS